MADRDVAIGISADPSGLSGALNQASGELNRFASQVKSQFQGINNLLGGFGKLAAAAFVGREVLEGIKASIDAAREFTKDALDLGRALGIDANEAERLKLMLAAVGVTTEEYKELAGKLTRQLSQHEEQLNKLGIRTREADGSYRNLNAIMLDAIKVVNGYKDGVDRTMAAQQVFGKGATAHANLLKLNADAAKDAAKEQEDLGLVVGKENVEAYEENRKAMDSASNVMLAIKKAVGDALLPALTQLAEWFRDIGPGAVLVFKGAIGGLVSVFWILKAVVSAVYDALKGVMETFFILTERIGQAIAALLSGDFKGAKQAFDGMGHEMAESWGGTWSEIVDDAKAAIGKIDDLFEEPTPTKGPKPDGDKHQTGPAPSSDEQFSAWKLSLEKIKDEQGEFRQKDIAADIVYWQDRLAAVGTFTKQDKLLRQKIESEILQLHKKARAEQLQLDEEAISQKKAMADAELALAEQDIRAQAQLGEITRQQELMALRQLEEKKYQIERQALQDKLALLRAEKVEAQKIMDQMLVIEKQHALANKKIDTEIAANKHVVFENMRQSFQSVLSEFFKGAKSIGDTIRGLMGAVLNSVTNMLAQMMARQVAVVAESLALHKSAALKQIAQDAAKAASGAYQAVVGIPYVGPFLAPPAAALAYAATMAFGTSMSAAKGYDVPAGVNPTTQLHQREMVLPEKYADVIRGMEGRGRGRGRAPTFAPKGINMPGGYFMAQRDELARALEGAFRHGGYERHFR